MSLIDVLTEGQTKAHGVQIYLDKSESTVTWAFTDKEKIDWARLKKNLK
jgi:hypothetical protein